MDTRISLEFVAAHSTVNGVFQTGATNTGWELNKVLKATHKLFNESPARCDVYLKEGSSSKFPIKFREAWCIEDQEVTERA